MTPFKTKKGSSGTRFKRLGDLPLLGPTTEFDNYNGASPNCAKLQKHLKMLFFAFLAQTERIPAKRCWKNLRTGTLREAR